MEKTLYVGKLDGKGVSITLEIEKKNQKRKTVEHKEVDSYYALSMTGDIRNGGGAQINDVLRKGLDEYVIPEENFHRIIEIWDNYHLNDMKAVCEHQISIPTNIANWSELAAKQTKLCPNGYKYGSSWLLKELPDGLVEEVLALFEGESMIPEDKMVAELEGGWGNKRKYAIPSHDIIITLSYNGKAKKEHGTVNRYNITVDNQESDNTISFLFYDSVHNTKEYDDLHDDLIRGVLSCIRYDYHSSRKYYPTFQSFCDAFGYNSRSKKDADLYYDVVRQAEKLQSVLTEELVATFPE